MVRKACDSDLVRPDLTHFATNYIALQSKLTHIVALKQVFASPNRDERNESHSEPGRRSKVLVGDPEFWDRCRKLIMIMEPVVKVLKLVDGDKKPMMDYLYEAIRRMKEAIWAAVPKSSKGIIQIIDDGWTGMLCHPLHEAVYYLNPKYHVTQHLGSRPELIRTLEKVVFKLERDPRVQYECMKHVKWYRDQLGSFGRPSAIAALDNTASGLVERFQHKNRLQQYVQRCGIPLPAYQTFNEGSSHAPQFRSAVTIDGQKYRSGHTFANRKDAEQDVAKFALESICWRMKQEGLHLISGDTTFCKSILHEYAAKMKIEKPAYTTNQSEGLLPTFITSVVFDEKTYTGDPGKNKKEAEQIAARTVIETILGHFSTRTLMAQVIRSKSKFYDLMHKGIDYVSSPARNVVIRRNMESHSGNSVEKGKEPAATLNDSEEPSNGTGPHDTIKPKQEYVELNSDSVGREISLRYQQEGAPPPGPVSMTSARKKKLQRKKDVKIQVKRARHNEDNQQIIPSPSVVGNPVPPETATASAFIPSPSVAGNPVPPEIATASA